jgi:hypothetical protein
LCCTDASGKKRGMIRIAVKPVSACLFAAFLVCSAGPNRFALAIQPAVRVTKAVPAVPVAVHFGPGGAFQLDYKIVGGTTVVSQGVVEKPDANGGTKRYPLPQSSFETYAKLRPADLKLNPISATANNYDRDEMIGPHQIEGDRLWFGNNFYDGEGERGVGAFGYFDARTRQYSLYSPPEVAAYEISALLVEPDVVWVALDHQGEDISKYPGGLIRWNKGTQQTRRYPIEFVVNTIAREGEALKLTTNGGYALLTNDVVRRFRITGTTITPIDRFPPPPSKDQLQ